MKPSLALKPKKRLPTGRPPGIAQPDGPERIRRKLPVIYDSLLKRALGGDSGAIRLCLEVVGEIEPSADISAEELKGIFAKVVEEIS